MPNYGQGKALLKYILVTMIYDKDSDSDSGAESDNAKSGKAVKPTQSLPTGSRPIPFPVVQNVQQQLAREMEKPYKLNSPPRTSSPHSAHERSPSLPVRGALAPRVNVEEVDGTSDSARVSKQRHPAGSASSNARRQRGHVKAPSADWSVDLALARRGSPSDFSYDSDSSESPFPVPSHIPRVRTETMDSDTLLLTMSRDAMPMVKQGSEVSDTGSLIVPPTTRGASLSDDSTEEGDFNQEKKLLYLMVARCIAYPFNAKYQLETAPPKPKLNEERFKAIVELLDSCRNQDWDKFTPAALSINNSETKCLRSEKFLNCLDWYMDNVLGRDDVITMSKNGSFSVKELESIFKVLATKHIMYTSKELDVDSSELHIWCSTFRKLVEHGARGIRSGYSGARGLSPNENSGTGPNREKLYKLFQKILNIKSIEHQILYRACQVSCRVRLKFT